MNRYTRRGFTLVELLIVIVVIGVLSAMMMLSSTEAVSSAKAARIISNLRNLKTAALAWYADNLDFIEGRVTDANGNNFTCINDNREAILKYLGSDAEIDDRYQFSNQTRLVTGQNSASDTDNMSWYIWYQIGENWTLTEDRKVLEKLAKRGKSVKLRYTTSPNDWQPSGGLYTDSSQYQWGIGLHIFGKNYWGDPK